MADMHACTAYMLSYDVWICVRVFVHSYIYSSDDAFVGHFNVHNILEMQLLLFQILIILRGMGEVLVALLVAVLMAVLVAMLMAVCVRYSMFGNRHSSFNFLLSSLLFQFIRMQQSPLYFSISGICLLVGWVVAWYSLSNIYFNCCYYWKFFQIASQILVSIKGIEGIKGIERIDTEIL